ncbi:MAG: hypothetical protein ACNA8K_09160 [Cyclonatronaceae bacterium]
MDRKSFLRDRGFMIGAGMALPFVPGLTKISPDAAAYIGANPGEIALTGSTTEGLGTLYSGFKLKNGDEILTTTPCVINTEQEVEASLRAVAELREYHNDGKIGG